ncbi:winged helix-turn-helix transcriptional regulator [Candidatus Saccharibacteria bacterium]|nr:winged helix-turn-helix transcriptional regulator [Candidatus Saccharibacteria bacterium]
MVEQRIQLDLVFAALSDSTRRDILARVAKIEMSIGEIAEHYKMTFAGIAKHVKVLERAGLVIKKRRGKEQVVIIVPSSLSIASSHIEQYAKMWSERFNQLETLLKEEK